MAGAFSSVSPDVVETVEQAMLAERIDVEADRPAVGAADLLFYEVDRERRVGAALGVVEQLLEILRRHRDRENAVFETVVVEDVREARGDHATDAEVRAPTARARAMSRSRNCRPRRGSAPSGRRAC